MQNTADCPLVNLITFQSLLNNMLGDELNIIMEYIDLSEHFFNIKPSTPNCLTHEYMYCHV